MFCRKCGTETSDDSQFCRKCGLGLAVSVTSGGAGAAVAPARIAEAPKKQTVRTPFIIAGVLLLAFAIFGISARYNRSANPANTIDRPFRQQHITTLKNPALRINALNFDYFKLDVPLGATNAL